jgi:hypothetical protein
MLTRVAQTVLLQDLETRESAVKQGRRAMDRNAAWIKQKAQYSACLAKILLQAI